MTKTLAGSIILTCLCMSSLAQTPEQLEAYKAAVQSQENVNRVQREAGMPEMAVPTFEEWLKAEEEKASSPAPAVSAEKQEDPEIKWAKKLETIQPQLCELKPVKDKSIPVSSAEAIKEKERLLKAAEKAAEKQAEIERTLDSIAARYGVGRTKKSAEGKTQVLAGEFNGHPIWIESHNQIAAAGISADELWPTYSAPWPSSSTGRDLTGTNVILGMWEAEGGVLTDHQEFSGRVLQMDNPTNLDNHASGVAGTMAAGGSTISLPGLATGELARGVAFNAYVDAYDIRLFQSEISAASAGSTNFPGLRASNFSWGIDPQSWYLAAPSKYFFNPSTGQYEYYSGSITYPVWNWDDFSEEPFCGLYFSNTNGTGCVQLDALTSTNAPRHLLVFSAGNSRFWGIGNQWDRYFYWSSSYGTYVVAHLGTSADIKDKALGDGDTYGFDTIGVPGTAKNVLTVGSVKDVWHTENNQLVWGYASNSTINVSDFSSCGPTDDGRIKPDVMAVGEADSTVRSYGIVTPISSATDSYTNNYSGTSFSAPAVTGGLGLCLERRNQLFPDLDPEIDDLLNSSLKALAIHTADDVLNTGPDYLTGWGLFNAVSAVEQVELDAQDGRGTHIKELELTVGETNSWTVYLDGSAFKVTIAWSDLPGEFTGYVDDDTPMLVNNLDLWIENEAGTQVFQPWVLDPDLAQERESVRNTPATTGYDDINNIEQVEISATTPGFYKIFITHAGGTSGGQPPSLQKVSILSSGDTPLAPEIAEFEQSPTNGTFLLSVKCDPGAHMQVESCTDLSSGSWQTNGTFTTVANTNSVLVTSSSDVRFWRVRRETGIGQ